MQSLAVNRTIFKDESHRDVQKQVKALKQFYASWLATLSPENSLYQQISVKMRVV